MNSTSNNHGNEVSNKIDKLTISQPDDWHVHLRDHGALAITVPDIAHYFARAIVMPNTVPPITTIDYAHEYYQRICQHIPQESNFKPLMTLYLTAQTTPELIQQAATDELIYGVKLYPAHATTHSQWGVHDLNALYPVFAALEKHQLPLLIHGEVTDANIDVFDREHLFIEQKLIPLLRDFPGLRVVLEHITTEHAVNFITEASDNVAATITAHHLLYNRNAIFQGGIRPHMYCLPILKRQQHQQALLRAATSGNPKFFLGTDSAPHARHTKEAHCGCAGIYTAHAALELYATAFAQMNALDKLEGFASFYGADFYRLPRNRRQITLVQEEWQVPGEIAYINDDVLIPLCAGEKLAWRVV
jgi:dihydroorotase